MRELIIETKRESYPVYIGSGLLEKVGSLVAKRIPLSKAIVITDDKVANLYLDKVVSSIESSDCEILTHTIPSGESSKNIEEYLKIIDLLSEEQFSGSDAVIALGGGVVGDIAGFAAATYLRGVRFVQIPTTLLAAVDSSVGGKTAINLPSGKNQLGSFYQPDLVICDTGTLKTLSKEIFEDGCAEVIKYGIIADKELFEMFKEPLMPQIEEIIERCLKIKGSLVLEDEFDQGVRHFLNYGHTFGHAIEKCSSYQISHGRAVGIGMVLAAKVALSEGLCSKDTKDKIEEMIISFGLPVTTNFNDKELYDAMISDKKRRSEFITLVLPKEIGECLLQKVKVAELPRLVKLALSDGSVR
ncbi:MAG: 3-dehydroquinate synthase [Synergistaceae bacterium]